MKPSGISHDHCPKSRARSLQRSRTAKHSSNTNNLTNDSDDYNNDQTIECIDDPSDPDYETASTRSKRSKPVPTPRKRKPADDQKGQSRKRNVKDTKPCPKLAQQCKDDRKKATELRKEKKEIKSERSQLMAEKRDLLIKIENQRNATKEEIQDLNRAFAEREHRFMQAEREWQFSRKLDLFRPLPDDITRQHFAIILDKCVTWINEWCITSLTDVSLECVRRIVLTGLPYDSHVLSESVIKQLRKTNSAAPKILITAELTRFMFCAFLVNPFKLVSKLESLENIQTSLFSVYNLLKKDDIAKACRWRSDTLRSLPRFSELANDFQKSDNAIQQGRYQVFIEGMVDMFLVEKCAELLKTRATQLDVDKCSHGLASIFMYMGQFSTHLWCQKLNIELPTVSQLLGHKFSTSLDLFRSHTSTRLDDGDSRLDGSRISFVVVPAILAFGDADGNHFEASKVWSRAIVLVSDEKLEDSRSSKIFTRDALVGSLEVQDPRAQERSMDESKDQNLDNRPECDSLSLDTNLSPPVVRDEVDLGLFTDTDDGVSINSSHSVSDEHSDHTSSEEDSSQDGEHESQSPLRTKAWL